MYNHKTHNIRKKNLKLQIYLMSFNVNEVNINQIIINKLKVMIIYYLCRLTFKGLIQNLNNNLQISTIKTMAEITELLSFLVILFLDFTLISITFI